jgi:hypothetical protein
MRSKPSYRNSKERGWPVSLHRALEWPEEAAALRGARHRERKQACLAREAALELQ